MEGGHAEKRKLDEEGEHVVVSDDKNSWSVCYRERKERERGNI